MERRKVKRRFLLYYARIFNPASRQLIGNLIDITPRGAMVLSQEPFTVGSAYSLRIELSDDVSDQPHMDINAVARWSHPDIEPSLYNTGFEFQEMGKEERRSIDRIVKKYGFRDNNRN